MTFPHFQNPQGDWDALVKKQAAEQCALDNKFLVERLPLLSGEILIQRDFYAHLGWIGARFDAAFSKAAAPLDFDVSMIHSRAVLTTHDINQGFVREITFGQGIAMDSNRYAIFWALSHEGTHLFNQYDRVPATHATPFNIRAPVVLCPRDAMVLNVLMERQAFAMEVLMDDILADVASGKMAAADIPPPVELQTKLQKYAFNINKRIRWDTETAFIENYRHNALRSYEEFGRVAHLKNNHIGYARLGLADLRILNDCLGMKTFGDTDEALSRLLTYDFTPAQQARLDKINTMLGLENEEALPILEDALAAHGISTSDFLKTGASRMAGGCAAANDPVAALSPGIAGSGPVPA